MALLQRYIVCVSILLLFFSNANAQTYVFAKLQGSPVDISGWNPEGTCYVGNTPVGIGNSEIILTNPVNSSSGSIFYQTPINLSACRKWFAEFDFRMFDGNQADGLSFCYLDNPPVGSVIGAGLGIPANANGLKVCFDTWRNCGSDAIPKIQIRWGTGYDECNGQPTRSNNDGALSFLRSNSYNHCKIEYDQGNISVFVNNTLYLTAFQTFNFPGYFGFTASTGGSTDRHSIKNVVIYTEMPPSFAGSDVAICPKDSAQLGGSLNPLYTYLWSPATGLSDPTISNPKVSLDNAGINSYSQKYIVQTSFATNPGCASRDTVEVLTRVRPIADFNFTATCLPNAVVSFSDATTIGDGQPTNFTYAWNFGDPNASGLNFNTSTVQTPSHIYTSAGPFSVSLSATSVQGCKGDTVKQIANFRTRPKALIQAPAETCMAAATIFNDISNGMSSTVTKWNWDFGDGGVSTLKNPAHVYMLAGNYTVKLWVENAIGCLSDTAEVTILVNPLPTVAFTAPVSECQNNLIQFTDVSSANAGSITSWNWNFGDAIVDNVQNPAHRYLVYGDLIVSLNVITDKGCTATGTKAILVHPAPAMDFTVMANCSGANAQFTNLAQLAGGSQSDLLFVWRFNDPGATPSNPDTSVLTNPVHVFNAGGIYNVSLQATSPFNCRAVFVKPITIVGQPQVIIQLQKQFCSNTIPSFADSSVVPFGTLSRRTVYWDWENVPTVSVVDNAPAIGNIYLNQYPSFGGNATKRLVIKNIASSANGCNTERFDTIQLLPVPQLVFDSLALVCISPNTFTINQARETSGINGTGIYSGNGINALGIFNPSQAGVGPHRITYIFTPANGCADTVFRNITVNQTPAVNAGIDKTIIQGGAALLEAIFSANATSFLWSPAQTLNNALIARPLASPIIETMYTVTATSNENCSATDSVLVKILPGLRIPNVFSPNKDGINDVWNIPYLNSYIDCTMDIFDRFGRKIFSSVGYNQPWDATFNSRELPVGVYYYLLDIKNGKAPVSGSVTVLR
jgi:gliding motility-associated-like protein